TLAHRICLTREACPAHTCLVRQRGGPQSAPEATATPTPSHSGRQHRKWPPDCWLQPRRLTAWGEPQRLAAGSAPFLSEHCDTFLVRCVVRAYGVTLAGPAPVMLVDAVSAAALRTEILATMRSWGHDILATPD